MLWTLTSMQYLISASLPGHTTGIVGYFSDREKKELNQFHSSRNLLNILVNNQCIHLPLNNISLCCDWSVCVGLGLGLKERESLEVLLLEMGCQRQLAAAKSFVMRGSSWVGQRWECNVSVRWKLGLGLSKGSPGTWRCSWSWVGRGLNIQVKTAKTSVPRETWGMGLR